MRGNYEKFIVSQKAVLIRNDKALILEFKDKNNGWDIPGGRFDSAELGARVNVCGRGMKSFKREIREETGLNAFENLGAVDYDLWRTPSGQAVCGIVNLIINDVDDIRLSDEHGDMRWIFENEIDNYRFLWPMLPRMIKKGFERYKLLKKI
jgi:8-oxo-dGTP pyrophosphatase MutT (NUDIX family)